MQKIKLEIDFEKMESMDFKSAREYFNECVENFYKEYRSQGRFDSADWGDYGKKETRANETILMIRRRDGEISSWEEKFRAEHGRGIAMIEEQLRIAEDAISRACEISEEFSIPFCSIGGVINSYLPRSLMDKRDEIIRDLEGLSHEFQLGAHEWKIEQGWPCGWEHSDIC